MSTIEGLYTACHMLKFLLYYPLSNNYMDSQIKRMIFLKNVTEFHDIIESIQPFLIQLV